jgi:hypothetical protein
MAAALRRRALRQATELEKGLGGTHVQAKTFCDNLYVYNEVEPIVTRYESRLPYGSYWKIVKGTRHGKARSCLRSGFDASRSRRRITTAILAVLGHTKP